MRLARIVTAVVLAWFAGTGCSDAAVSAVAPTPAAPAVASGNTLVAATVGAPLAYDATKGGTVFTDPALKGLTYANTLNGGAGGLSAASGVITGVPTGPGTIVTFTNLDNARHSAGFASPLITSTPIFLSGSRTVIMPAALGTYAYQCAIHGAAMRGTIVVR